MKTFTFGISIYKTCIHVELFNVDIDFYVKPC